MNPISDYIKFLNSNEKKFNDDDYLVVVAFYKFFELDNSNVFQTLKKSIFEKTNNVSVSTKVVNRRAGDVAKSYATASLAYELLGFECKKTVADMCEDAWNWQNNNPNGYKS